MLRIYVSIDKLNCPSPTSRVRWHQGLPASPCVKFRRFPRSTIPDNSAMCLNTQNRCIRREENAVCLRIGFMVALQRFMIVCLHVSRISRVAPHYCAVARETGKARMRFCPIGIGKDCADRKRNVESALAFSPTRIEKRG